jgi:hypothetical protein
MIPWLTAAALTLTVATAPAAGAAPTTTGKAILGRLPVAAESHNSTYDRARFRHWTDADGNGCDTRAEVLIAESTRPVTYGSGCTVRTGRWVSWYDDRTWTRAGDVDVDHVVALGEAWGSGAWRWSASLRQAFANDLAYSWSLDAVTDNVNQAKGSRDPAEWLPPRHRCKYARHWVAVKYRWRLTVDRAERDVLAAILRGDCGAMPLKVPPHAYNVYRATTT